LQPLLVNKSVLNLYRLRKTPRFNKSLLTTINILKFSNFITLDIVSLLFCFHCDENVCMKGVKVYSSIPQCGSNTLL